MYYYLCLYVRDVRILVYLPLIRATVRLRDACLCLNPGVKLKGLNPVLRYFDPFSSFTYRYDVSYTKSDCFWNPIKFNMLDNFISFLSEKFQC